MCLSCSFVVQLKKVLTNATGCTKMCANRARIECAKLLNDDARKMIAKCALECVLDTAGDDGRMR